MELQTKPGIKAHISDILYEDEGYDSLSSPLAWLGGVGEPFLHREGLEAALRALNTGLGEPFLSRAVKRLLTLPGEELATANEKFHHMLLEGLRLDGAGEGNGNIVRLMDFEYPEKNKYTMYSGFTSSDGAGGSHSAYPDQVLLINGFPIVLFYIEPRRDEEDDKLAPLKESYRRLNRGKREIPALFCCNGLLVITDGYDARVGSISASFNRFTPWRSHTHHSSTVKGVNRLDFLWDFNFLRILLKGLLRKDMLLDVLRFFTIFQESPVPSPHRERGGSPVKIVAACHQYFAVKRAVESTCFAASIVGDQRCGVVWHTQGSGKSLTMLFYAAQLAHASQLRSPTIVVLTDRNDLEEQLLETFRSGRGLLTASPVQAENRRHLIQLLRREAGGIIFTTVQKFFPRSGRVYPLLSRRRNIVVIADEAHRSQYDFIDGFARHMRDALPNASFIGFTGTPLEKEDRNTRAVFGEYIDVYDIHEAVRDGATVNIYYESRLSEVSLDEGERRWMDLEIETVSSHRDARSRGQLKRRLAKLETILGERKHVASVCRDIVTHFEERGGALFGKGMVVAVSRRVCIDMYNEIIGLRPHWRGSETGEKGEKGDGQIKVVITGSPADPPQWREHIRDKEERRLIGERFKNPDDPLKMVIVCDMWLTGFDVPCLHTLYVDKPLSGHILMQAIARVNRVFRDKPGGLVVDYFGFASQLKKALSLYTESGGHGSPYFSQDHAAARFLEELERMERFLSGFDYHDYFGSSEPGKESVMTGLLEYILETGSGPALFCRSVRSLTRAFTLAVPHPGALRYRDEIGFFQAVKGRLMRLSGMSPIGSPPGGENGENDGATETAIRRIVSRAVVTGPVIGLFEAAGIKKTDISILSPPFLEEIRHLPHPRVAVEFLTTLLRDEVGGRSRQNLVQGRAFSQMLRGVVNRCHERQVSTRQVMEELIDLARRMRDSDKREREMLLSPAALAFFDALASPPKVRSQVPEKTLKAIALELEQKVKKNVSIDWALKESARARLKVLVKRTLRIHGYPVEESAEGVELLLKQAELLAGKYFEACASGGPPGAPTRGAPGGGSPWTPALHGFG